MIHLQSKFVRSLQCFLLVFYDNLTIHPSNSPYLATLKTAIQLTYINQKVCVIKLRCKKYTESCLSYKYNTAELITHVLSEELMGSMLTLNEVRLEGKTVLLRVDFNSPLDPSTGAFLDLSRIKAAIPTINALSKSKVVILTHQSRPGKSDFTTTSGHSRELQRLLGRPVRFVEDIHGEDALNSIGAMENGDILMLNNIRMDNEEISNMDEYLSDTQSS